MNSYFFKPLILRPVKNDESKNLNAYAIVKLNFKKSELTFSSASLFNKNSGEYFLLLSVDNKVQFYLLDSLKKEQSILLSSETTPTAFAVIKQDARQTLPILFGEYPNNKTTLSQILKSYAQEIKKTTSNDSTPKTDSEDLSTGNQSTEQFTTKHSPSELSSPTDSAIEQINEANIQKNLTTCEQNCNQSGQNVLKENTIEYNDEAIAQENYYELYKKEHNENLFKQTDLSNNGDKQESKTEEVYSHSSRYENSACENTREKEFNSKGEFSAEPTFYYSVKEKIDALFEKYPPFAPLNELISKGKWVKIPYGSDKFYIVGVVYENCIPSYIVYGVPGYKNQKPQGFERYSAFIPESICDTQEKGFWCILQSAHNGEQIVSSD